MPNRPPEVGAAAVVLRAMLSVMYGCDPRPANVTLYLIQAIEECLSYLGSPVPPGYTPCPDQTPQQKGPDHDVTPPHNPGKQAGV